MDGPTALANRLKAYRSAHDCPAAKFVALVVSLAEELDGKAGEAAAKVPGSPLAAWCGPESAARLVGHLTALAWMCRSAAACISGETN